MTVQVNGKPAPATPVTPEDRIRDRIANARRDRDKAIESEYEGLLDIAYSHHQAAMSAIVAVSRAQGVPDDVRMDLISQAMDLIDSTRRWLGQAITSIRSNEPPF